MRSITPAFVLSTALAIGVAAAPGAAFAAGPGGTVTPRFEHAITNVPGKSLIAVEVDYPPGGYTPSHRHAPSAFVMGYVVSGAIRSQVEGQPARIYHAGDTFYENPGAHHLISANASATEPAKLLAVFVVDTRHGPLTTLDKQPYPKH